MKALVVTQPFNGHQIGHHITDEDEIEEVLAGEQSHHVVQSEIPDED